MRYFLDISIVYEVRFQVFPVLQIIIIGTDKYISTKLTTLSKNNKFADGTTQHET